MRDLGLQAAIDAMGNRSGNLAALAEKLGISSQAVSQWSRVPAERVKDVERVSGVPRETLRPDLFSRDDAEAA